MRDRKREKKGPLPWVDSYCLDLESNWGLESVFKPSIFWRKNTYACFFDFCFFLRAYRKRFLGVHRVAAEFYSGEKTSKSIRRAACGPISNVFCSPSPSQRRLNLRPDGISSFPISARDSTTGDRLHLFPRAATSNLSPLLCLSLSLWRISFPLSLCLYLSLPASISLPRFLPPCRRTKPW